MSSPASGLGVSADALDFAAQVAVLRAEKLEKLAPLLRDDLPSRVTSGKPDFLSDDLRASTGVAATAEVSSNRYDKYALALIDEVGDAGLVLDCGAGRRGVYFPSVVNFEIADYDTTDVIGVGEELPFKDASFDAVISIAVLEHVRNPFRCADEIARVLKPGGKLICCAPFLQPYHGYPHHYFNMSWQGLRALFEDELVIDDHKVTGSMTPVWTLSWMVESWAKGLPSAARERFLNLRLSDLLASPRELRSEDWAAQLPEGKNFELASATMLFATKPADPSDPPLQPRFRQDHYFKPRRPAPSWLRRLFRRR